jgi:predicted DNA-binding WGR domain protein
MSLASLIDEHCKYKNAEIFKDFYCTLTQTMIAKNKNKFYIMQLLKLNNGYIHYIRYGRIGETGKMIYRIFNLEQDAIKSFVTQFKTKTKNNWFSRDEFVKVDKKYYLVDLAQTDIAGETIIIEQPKSNLSDRVQFLINLISNVGAINKIVSKKLNVNINKMPLGKMSDKQIDEANDILKLITNHIVDGINYEERLVELSSKFYTLIPYSFGRKTPPIIKTKELVQHYMDTLDELRSAIIAIKIIGTKKKNLHTYDTIYENLDTKITPLDKGSTMWNIITDYIKNTHGITHKFKVDLLDIFKLQKSADYIRPECSNKMLLWHGSGMVNYCSILKNGLILNPERLGVAITGKMFGQGIYFTNALSKSVGYTACENSDNVGALLLCEVALGDSLRKTSADHTITLEQLNDNNYQSVYGIGRYSPSSFVMNNGVKIPNGILHEDMTSPTCLLYDEMVIYNTNQIKLSYLVLVRKTK